MMPSTPLPVVPPSSARLEPYHDETTKPSGFPDAEVHTAPRAGSNSILAVCHCGREFDVASKSDDLPHHHHPAARGYLKRTCDGSGRRATLFAEA